MFCVVNKIPIVNTERKQFLYPCFNVCHQLPLVSIVTAGKPTKVKTTKSHFAR